MTAESQLSPSSKLHLSGLRGVRRMCSPEGGLARGFRMMRGVRRSEESGERVVKSRVSHGKGATA